MLKKMRGFTLIELLIVVAIIGILAALLIPNAMSAIQKARQKGTMKDLNAISTSIMDFITDRGMAPDNVSGDIAVGSALVAAISPFYLKAVPTQDQWGHPLQAGTRTNCAMFGITAAAAGGAFGDDDFVVASFGRNDVATDHPYDPGSPSAGFYVIQSMTDFNNELVVWNGSWVVGPRSMAGTT